MSLRSLYNRSFVDPPYSTFMLPWSYVILRRALEEGASLVLRNYSK